MGRHQAVPAEQTAWRAACERPARPQWHLLGLAVRRTMARSAREFWAAHDLLQSLRSLAQGWRVGPDHEYIERRPRCGGTDGPVNESVIGLGVSNELLKSMEGRKSSTPPGRFSKPVPVEAGAQPCRRRRKAVSGRTGTADRR